VRMDPATATTVTHNSEVLTPLFTIFSDIVDSFGLVPAGRIAALVIVASPDIEAETTCFDFFIGHHLTNCIV